MTDLENDEERLAEIVRLFPDPDEHDEEQPATKAEQPREQRYCRHKKVTLDTEAHRVFCRDCEAEVDPFAVMLSWSQDWDRITQWRKEASRRANEAGNRLSELLRLERNARSRLKRIDPHAEKKAPAKPWGEQMPMR